jgi:hypothetical protein
MQHIVEEFEKRTGKKLKEREAGVLSELIQKDLLGNLKLSVVSERVEDFEGVSMGSQRKLVLKFGDTELSKVNISDISMRY